MQCAVQLSSWKKEKAATSTPPPTHLPCGAFLCANSSLTLGWLPWRAFTLFCAVRRGWLRGGCGRREVIHRGCRWWVCGLTWAGGRSRHKGEGFGGVANSELASFGNFPTLQRK